MLEIIAYSFLVMLASLVGVISVWTSVGNFIEKNLRFLVSFSAGVFLFISWELSQEVLENSTSWFSGILWIIAGVFFIWLIFKTSPSFHHHHDSEEKHHHDKLDARRIIIGDFIHNIGDGVLIASSFIAGPTVGAIAAISVFIHEIVQEISEFFVLKQAGFSTTKALVVNFAVSASILIGSVGTYLLVDIFENLKIPLLGLSAGSFLVVVVYDLIPHSIRSSKTKIHYAHHLLAFLAGIIVMTIIGTLTHHTH